MNKETALKHLFKIIEKHPPNKSCKSCKGRGFTSFRPVKGSRLIWSALGRRPCVCCFANTVEDGEEATPSAACEATIAQG